MDYLSQDNTIEYESRQNNEAVNLYVAYGQDLTSEALTNGKEELNSKLGYFAFNNDNYTTASLIERMGYFLI